MNSSAAWTFCAGSQATESARTAAEIGNRKPENTHRLGRFEKQDDVGRPETCAPGVVSMA